MKGWVEERDWTDLKRDGNSHPANINKRAFGDNWPGFPLNFARYGSEFLTKTNDNIRPADSKEIKREKATYGGSHFKISCHASSFRKL